MIKTACGLDCYDACSLVVSPNEFPKVEGDRTHPVTQGSLCRFLYKSIHEMERISVPRIEGKEVSIDEAMEAVVDAFKAKSSLLWRGSGNVGVMQEVTNLFMEKIGATLTKGSLCDGAGHAGIVSGRGINKTLPLEQIAKADTVVVWGRNVTVTNSHIIPYLEGKKIVVIDPVKTEIAKRADIHLQIEPRTDYYIALMLARFIFMEDSQDDAWLKAFAPDFEDFYEYTREHRIKAILEHCGTDLGEMGRVLNYLRDHKVVFLVGAGVQKYSTGHYTLAAIDSLAATLGLFGKEGCGVSFLGDSKLGFVNPFDVSCKKVSKVVTEFSSFDTVLVQGGNPAESMPDSSRVQEELEGVENLIYFGLYENETSKRAKIVIPAKTFFEKEDLRLSYGDRYVTPMQQAISTQIGISEYAFTQYLFDAFGFTGLEEEAYYLDAWLTQCKKEGEYYISPAYETRPYEEGFGEEGDGEFVFIDDYDDDFINTKRFRKYRKKSQNETVDESYWLLSPKSKKSLNTQFTREMLVHMHPDAGYQEGQKVRLSSEYGQYDLTVKVDEDVRVGCVVVTSNTRGVNYLTPSIVSEEGESACYQEVKVTIESLENIEE